MLWSIKQETAALLVLQLLVEAGSVELGQGAEHADGAVVGSERRVPALEDGRHPACIPRRRDRGGGHPGEQLPDGLHVLPVQVLDELSGQGAGPRGLVAVVRALQRGADVLSRER